MQQQQDDKYKIFDTSEFQSRQVLGGRVGIDSNGIVIFNKHYGYKIAVPILLLCCTALLLLLFLFLYGASTGKVGELSQQVAAYKSAEMKTCKSELCLQQAAYITRIMNNSADPCSDFYEFACGNFVNSLGYDHWFTKTNVFKEMNNKAIEQIEEALVKPVQFDSPTWVTKVKHYYRTCIEYYNTYHHEENPLITRVLNSTDGLADFLFGLGVDRVNLDEMVQVVSGKYYIPSLLHSLSWWNDHLHKTQANKRYSIWVGRSRHSIGIVNYNLYYSQHQKIYVNFIKDIARLLIRDSKLTVANQDSIVDTFANDVLEVEKKLYEIQYYAYYSEWQTYYSDPPYHPENMVEVQELTRRFPFVNFKAYLQQIFGSQVRDSTKVVLYSSHYLDKLNEYFVNNNASTNQEFKRKISNYLTWLTTMFFEYDLSPEYRHKFQSISELHWSNKQYDAHSFCFANTEWGMGKALSALYIREYFHEDAKPKANKLFQQLVTATKANVDKLDWMEAETKGKAKAKVDSIVEKSGYPDNAKNDYYLNQEYQLLKPMYTDYFQLILDSIDYRKSLERRLLLSYDPLDFEHWGKLWNTHYSYHAYDNEILIQAGVLQLPLFSSGLPQQLVYGGFGSLIGHEIIQAIGVRGQLYDQSVGYQKSGWWSTRTLSRYKQKAGCVRESMRQMLEFYEKDRLTDLSDEDKEKKVNELLRNEVNWTVREMGGLKVAHDAFELHKSEGNVASKLPIFDWSEEQMFYISYAQMNCHHMGYFYQWYNWQRNWFPWKILVNTVVANTPGFAQEFNCPAGAQLNVQDKCSVY